jgi:hypothetical protein
MQLKAVQAARTAAVSTATTAVTIGFAGTAHADPTVGPCDPQALTVAAGPTQAGLGHRAVQLDFTLPSGAGSCELSGYPTVSAELDVASPVSAGQTPMGYLGGALPGTTVTLLPGPGAHAMVEWSRAPQCEIRAARATGQHLPCTTAGDTARDGADAFRPHLDREERGLCSLQVHPLTD